jgi:hypothetical protein
MRETLLLPLPLQQYEDNSVQKHRAREEGGVGEGVDAENPRKLKV